MTCANDVERERQQLRCIRIAMLKRCYNPENPSFPNYGGRGIYVCDRWRASVRDFIADVWPRPPGLQLDRIDNDRGYEPSNVRWATTFQQSQNRRNVIRVKLGDEVVVLKEACRRLGLTYRKIHKRVKVQGMTPEVALVAPDRYRPR